ncbi:MAG: TRAM domain-containing protein [bacterium]|nr:TRAM domain-containing protein [bacterium]
MLNIGNHVTVKIHDITSEGDGVGRIVDEGDSRDTIVFVPYTIPREICRVEITRIKKGHLNGKIVEILEKHPARIDPPCPYFGKCPGCSLQFIDYADQLAVKVNRIKRIFEHGIGADIDSFPSMQSPEPYGYRTHMTIGVDLTGSKPAIGFTDPETMRIVDIPKCMLMPEWSHADYSRLRSTIAQHRKSLPGKFSLRIFFDHQNKTTFVVNPRGSLSREHKVPKGIQPILSEFPKPETIIRTISGVKVGLHPSSFVQANEFLMETLYTEAAKKIDRDYGGNTLELYAGNGFFSLYLAKQGRDAVAIESDRLACDNIAKTARTMISNMKSGRSKKEPTVSVIQGKAEKQARGVLDLFKPCVVVANPPRSGINKEIIEAINPCDSVKQVVMISCDAATCVRDCKGLSEAGFKAGTPTIVDMYPQTAHAEIVVELKRE